MLKHTTSFIIIIIITTTTTTAINIIIIIIVTTTIIITIPTIIIINYYNCKSTLHWKRRKWSRDGGQEINRREDRKRTGDNNMHKYFIFVVSCCEPHWLCVFWAIAMSRLARYRPILGFHICMCSVSVLLVCFYFVIRCACVFLTLHELTINLYWLENHPGRIAEATDSGGSQLNLYWNLTGASILL